MAARFLNELLTPDVLALEERTYGRAYAPELTSASDPLGPDERAFIAARDSFYLASVSSSGWPYVQHRGGPKGFLRVTGPSTLSFSDLRGNRQLITAGNLAGTDRVALILMDYPNRQRLKILGHARILPSTAGAERTIEIEVVGFDWNCPAHITPRYTEAEIAEATRPLHRRIAELEEELRRRVKR